MESAKKRTQLIIGIVAQPNQANFAGNVHGGEIMKMMDSAAGAVAYKYAKCSVVTARVDELQFHLPIHVGALVTCTATIAYVGKSSMEVIVTVDKEDLKSDNPPQRALSAYFTMVALDKEGRPQKVPSLEVTSEEEKKLYEEGERRYQERLSVKKRCLSKD